VIWLSLRQQRLETVLTAALLAVAAALLVPVGLHMASVYGSSGAAGCVAHTVNGSGCGSIVDGFQNRFEHAGSVIPWLNFLPGLFGVLFAAPLVLELEHGTFRLSWTQSVTRRRWLVLKLAVVYLSGLLAAVALTLLLTWWRQPLDSLQGRMEPNVFDFEGIVPYAYTLFAISLVRAGSSVTSGYASGSRPGCASTTGRRSRSSGDQVTRGPPTSRTPGASSAGRATLTATRSRCKRRRPA
jgi:hypothetical protein